MTRLSLEERRVVAEASLIKARVRKESKQARPKSLKADPKVTAAPGPRTPRKFSQRRKLESFLSQGGKCATCGDKFQVADMDLDHRLALELGGAEDPSNHQMLCRPCHKIKTAADRKLIAKVHRQAAMMGPSEPSKHFRRWR